MSSICFISFKKILSTTIFNEGEKLIWIYVVFMAIKHIYIIWYEESYIYDWGTYEIINGLKDLRSIYMRSGQHALWRLEGGTVTMEVEGP